VKDDYIDEDLNYNVKINFKKFANPNSATIKHLFYDDMAKFFNSPEEMCEFMTTVGKNHPDGINFRYLLQLITHYTTSKALQNLEEKGMLTSDINDDGEVVYQLTEFGKAVSDELL